MNSDGHIDYDQVVREHTKIIMREYNKVQNVKAKAKKARRKRARQSRSKNSG